MCRTISVQNKVHNVVSNAKSKSFGGFRKVQKQKNLDFIIKQQSIK